MKNHNINHIKSNFTMSINKYNSVKTEKKWQKVWDKEGIYKTKDKAKGEKNFYHLVMFPYPSGDLHIGHWYNFGPADIFARFKKMSGYNVLSPIGFDAFGLPAENAAIKRGIHPKDWTYKNIKTMTAQLKQMGNMYDWSKQVITADPEYYKWTQWMFLQLYKNGLAYKKKAPANWCPKDKTVLANEQVVDGKCERCGAEVVQREIEQWLFKITDYAEKLLNGLDNLDWPEKTKTMQRNWIGKSEGTLVRFAIAPRNYAENPPAGGAERRGKEPFKFRSNLVPQVLSKEKYITYRLVSKNVKVGDVCEFLNWETKEKFASAKITKIEKRKMGDVSEKEEGHEKFKNRKEFYKTYSTYYGFKVTDGTDAWFYHFELVPEHIEVFTTRVDTIFGCTYLVVAPENSLIENLKFKIENYDEVADYIKKSEKKTDLMRTDLEKDKTGVELKGIKAVNSFNGNEVPVFVADYVLGGYGTGAVMAVPAHDERDYAFAKKYNLPIKQSVSLQKDVEAGEKLFTDDGNLIDSGDFTGLTSEEAREKMTKWLEGKKLGSKKVNYKIRDWLVSRQRYWGSPIPIVYCKDCGEVAVPEKDLPVKLPNVEKYLPTEEGKSPLAHSDKFLNTKCPQCGGKATRETDTMDTFVCSSWYYLRYTDNKNNKKFADAKKLKSWLPVDMYIGGAEHTVLHLLYSRFFTKVLKDFGYLNFNEPFSALRHQGIILGPDNQKMSKSRGNVIDPDELVEKFGADTVKMYLAFMGPYDQGGPWNPGGIFGVKRFLDRVWNLAKSEKRQATSIKDKELEKLLHKTIKKVGEDVENFRFNTAISSLMVLLNKIEENPEQLSKENFQSFIKLLSPFAPYLSEEIWQNIGNSRKEIGNRKFKSVHSEKWPKYNPKLIVDDKFKLVIQINSKVRDLVMVDQGISEEKAKEIALKSEKVKSLIGGRDIKKIIYVKNRLINIVI